MIQINWKLLFNYYALATLGFFILAIYLTYLDYLQVTNAIYHGAISLLGPDWLLDDFVDNCKFSAEVIAVIAGIVAAIEAAVYGYPKSENLV